MEVIVLHYFSFYYKVLLVMILHYLSCSFTNSSSGYTQSLYPNLVIYRFKNMFLKESLTRSFTVISSLNLGRSNTKRISSRRVKT